MDNLNTNDYKITENTISSTYDDDFRNNNFDT
jgi:hypothetical protein